MSTPVGFIEVDRTFCLAQVDSDPRNPGESSTSGDRGSRGGDIVSTDVDRRSTYGDSESPHVDQNEVGEDILSSS